MGKKTVRILTATVSEDYEERKHILAVFKNREAALERLQEEVHFDSHNGMEILEKEESKVKLKGESITVVYEIEEYGLE